MIEAPPQWSQLAATTVAQRWLARGETSVRALVARVVGAVARWAREGGQVADEREADALRERLAALACEQRALFATPVWLNAGTEPEPLTSACFVLGVEDSMRSLLEWNTTEGLIFQQGAGCGVNLSRIRSSREQVTRGGLASGPVSFMRGADAWAATIRSGGRARRGAKMVVLDADHPDVRAFVAAKAREEERGRALVRAGWDPREAQRSLALQQSNHALRVTDAFMEAALEDRPWQLRAVTTGAVLETIPARALLRACAEACWACGDPGLQFADAIAAWHTTPRSGPINASNPCGEFVAIDDSACNLASLHLPRFLAADGAGLDVAAFCAAVDDLLTAQDAIVSGSGYPTEAIARNARRLRQVGLGFTGLGELLLRLGLPYDSDEARAWAGALAALLTGAAYRRSAALARTLGAFAEYEVNRHAMTAVLERHLDAAEALIDGAAPAPRAVLSAALEAWEDALDAARGHGLRNAQVTLVAPTGTLSLALDSDTTGIEPYYAFAWRKRFESGEEVLVESRALPGALRRLGYDEAATGRLLAHARAHGQLGDAPDLRPRDAPLLATALGPPALSRDGHLRMVAAVQPLLSGGVSKTLNLPAEATVEDVEAAFTAAWRLGLKAIAVYRQGSKVSQPIGLP